MSRAVKGMLGSLAGLFIVGLFVFKRWQPQTPIYSYRSSDTSKGGNALLQPIEFNSNNCYLNTKEIKRANGLHLDIYYPCGWESIIQPRDSIDDVNLVARYGYQKSDSVAYALSIDIKKANFKITPAALEALRSQNGLKKVGEASGTFLEGIETEIRGVPGDEIVVKNNPADGYYGYTLISHLYYKDNIIAIRYIVLSISEQVAERVFREEKDNFRKWVFQTEFR